MTQYTKEVVLNGILAVFVNRYNGTACEVYDKLVEDKDKTMGELSYIDVKYIYLNDKVIDILHQINSLVVQSGRILRVNIESELRIGL